MPLSDEIYESVGAYEKGDVAKLPVNAVRDWSARVHWLETLLPPTAYLVQEFTGKWHAFECFHDADQFIRELWHQGNWRGYTTATVQEFIYHPKETGNG